MHKRIELGAWYDGNVKTLAESLLENWLADRKLVQYRYFEGGKILFIEYVERDNWASRFSQAAQAIAGVDLGSCDQRANLGKAYRVAAASGCIPVSSANQNSDQMQEEDRNALKEAFEKLVSSPPSDAAVCGKIAEAVVALLE